MAKPRPKGSVSTGTADPGAKAKPGAVAEPTKVETKPEADSDESKLVRKRNVPPFWLDREFDTHRTRALLLPPVFYDRRPPKGKHDEHPEKTMHADLALTFGWYSRRAKKTRWMSVPGLFFGSYSPHKTVWGTVPLLMGYKRLGEQYRFGQFPLFWAWGNKHVKNFVAAPFHYQQKAPEGYRGVSMLLFWYGHKNLDDTDILNDRKHFVGAPVFYRFRRGPKVFQLSLLHTAGRHDLKGTKHQTVAGLYHWQSLEFGNRKELWTAVWVQRKDRARRKAAWWIPPLFTFSHRDPDRKVLSVTPLFWRARNHLKGSLTTIAGPVGVYRDPRQRNNFVAPLWWQFHDVRANAKLSILAPLAIAHRTPRRRQVWTLLAGGSKSKDGGWSFGVPPLLTFAGKNDEGMAYQGILGLFWHARDPAAFGGTGSRHLVLGPLAFTSRRGKDRDIGLVPALSFFGRRGTARYQIVTPMFWHVNDPARRRRTVVLPPAYFHRLGDHREGALVPLLFAAGGDKRRYVVIPPLLAGHSADLEAGTSRTISPLFAHARGPNSRTVGVLNLFWDVKYDRERHSVMFPLYYRKQTGDRVLHLSLLGGGLRDGDRRTFVAGPLYWGGSKTRRQGGLVPLVFYQGDRLEGGKRARHLVIPPLIIHRRTPGDDFDMITPLVWRSAHRGERARKGLAVVPMYFRQRQPGGIDVDAGLGWFYSRNETRTTHTLIAGPGFHRLSRKKLHAGLVPIYWWMDSKDKRRLLALPLTGHFHNKENDSHTTIAVPLWFDRKTPNQARTWVAFPFIISRKRLHNFTRVGVGAPGYFDIFRLKKNYRFTGAVPFAFRYQECGFRAEDEASCQYTVWGSFPLFMSGKDGRGRRTHGALMLYYWDRDKEGRRLYTIPFGYNYKPGKQLGWYALTLGVKTTQTHNRVMFLPLFYRKSERLDYRPDRESTTLILPPLFIGQQKRDRGWFQSSLLVWHFRQQHKVNTAVVPPVFIHSHSYAQRRFTWLMPLLIRDNQMGKDQTWTSVLPGLYVQRRRGKDLDFVQVPLVWHFERGKKQGTVGGFVWYDFRGPRKLFQMVPGLFFRGASSTRDTKIIGPGLAWWINRKGKREGDMDWRTLLGLIGGGRENGKRYFSLFGAKIWLKGKPKKRIETGPAKTKRTALRRAKRQNRRRLRLLARSRVPASRPGT